MSMRRVRVIRPARPALGMLVEGLVLLVQYGGLLWSMTTTRMKTRYRHSVLGWLWAVLQPLALMGLYSFIFSRVTSYSTAPVPYSLFVLAGLLPWTFCATSISTASAGMVNYQPLMAKIYFPREIIPLSYVGASLADLAIALGLLVVLMLFRGIPVTATAFQAVPILLILVVFVAALCLLVSSAQIRVRDIGVALPMLLQILMFTTPVVYPVSAVPADLRDLFRLNPLAILIEGFRGTMLGTGSPTIGELAYCTLAAFFCLVGSYLVFKKIEPTVVDEM